MVRRRGLRAEDERGRRNVLPVYAPETGASGRHLRLLRKACQAYDLLGRRVLKIVKKIADLPAGRSVSGDISLHNMEEYGENSDYWLLRQRKIHPCRGFGRKAGIAGGAS